MSLLTICQNVITELGFGASPASVIGNNDALTAQCLALARRAVKDIQARHDWSANTYYSRVATGDGSQFYPFPSGEDVVGDSLWDSTNHRKLQYVTPEVFAAIFNSSAGGSIPNPIVFTQASDSAGGRALLFSEALAVGTEIYAFTNNLLSVFNNADQVYRDNFENDADSVVAFSETLVEMNVKWRLKRAKGFDYSEERAEYDQQLSWEIGKDRPPSTLSFTMRGTSVSMPNLPPTIPEPV